MRRNICEPYLILLIFLHNKNQKGGQKNSSEGEEGVKTWEKFLFLSFCLKSWPVESNEVKDMNKHPGWPSPQLHPTPPSPLLFSGKILERNEAKFSPLLNLGVKMWAAALQDHNWYSCEWTPQIHTRMRNNKRNTENRKYKWVWEVFLHIVFGYNKKTSKLHDAHGLPWKTLRVEHKHVIVNKCYKTCVIVNKCHSLTY